MLLLRFCVEKYRKKGGILMKIRHNILSMVLILILVTLLSGCVGGKADSRLVGKWELAEDVTLMGFIPLKKGPN